MMSLLGDGTVAAVATLMGAAASELLVASDCACSRPLPQRVTSQVRSVARRMCAAMICCTAGAVRVDPVNGSYLSSRQAPRERGSSWPQVCTAVPRDCYPRRSDIPGHSQRQQECHFSCTVCGCSFAF